MAIVGGEGDKANVTGKDLAAALAPERGPVLNKEVVSIKERYIKDQGKSVFEADLAQNPEDLMVNFDEMNRVLDSEKKRVDAEKDPKKHDVLEKRYDRLQLRFNIYDKLLNNEGFTAMDGAEQQELINTMSALPGFAEAASVAIGGRLSTDQMIKVLSGKGGVAVTRDEKKTLSEIIVSMANDDRFKNRVSKSLSGLKLDDKDAENTQKLEEAKLKTKNREDQIKELTDLKAKRDTYTKTPDEQEEIQRKIESIQKGLRGMEDDYTPSRLTSTDIVAITDRTKREAAQVKARLQAYTPTPRITTEPPSITADRALLSKLEGYQTKLETAGGQLGGWEEMIGKYEEYQKVNNAIQGIETNLVETSKDMSEVSRLENEKSKYSDVYKRKMEVALSEEMKRYWNEVSLSNASKAAEARAAIKGEEEKVAEDLKTERVKIAEDILERFTHLSYMKYENGEAKGMDNAAIKKFVKKDMLSRSPKQLSRDILDRIIQNRGRLPRSYGKEIDGLLKKMGVGEGTPPATARDVLNAIDASEYQKWAELKIPDVMGYARGQGYYFDQLRLKPGQAEFIRRAYPEGFFEKAAAAKEKYEGQAAQLMGGEFKDFITDGALNWKKVKEALAGKDWKEGMNKLMKYTAYLGAGYVLGGGLAWGIGTPSALAMGADQVRTNLKGVGLIATGAVTSVSKLSNVALHSIMGNPTTALGGSVLTPEIPAVIGPGGGISKPAIPAVLSGPEPSKAGGLIGVLDKLAGKVDAVRGPTPAP